MTAETAKPPYSRTRPFPGKLLVNRRISSEDSGKETRHFEISIAGSGFNYEPGDSMAVYPSNDPQLVEEIIQALGASGMRRCLQRKRNRLLSATRCCVTTA